jgi:hypothetical protein
MTTLFPHTAYAEDQPSARTILYTHVTRASAMSFAFIGALTAPASLAISRYRTGTTPNLTPVLLKHTGRGMLIGAVAGPLMTWGHMRGREDIEWQDRAWRLQENRGEVDTDVWVAGSMAAGAVVAALGARRGMVTMGSAQAALGGAGLGMASGTGYMIYTFLVGRKPA